MSPISVTVQQAVALTGIGRTTLYQLFKQGDLKPRKVGGRTLVLVDELERFVRSLPIGTDEAGA